MDYVYGELSQKMLKNTYVGGSTSSADVRVDNANSIIYVDSHIDTTSLATVAISGNYNDLSNKPSFENSLKSLTGYDATKIQVLKNVRGVLTWIDEA